MSFSLTPSKRSYDRGLTDSNGKGKWQKSWGHYSQNQSLKVSPGTIVFRVLCPASKTGSVIGKGGTIISQIRQETGAKVRVEGIVSGCDERIVLITGSDKESEADNEQSKEDCEDAKAVEEVSDTKEPDENDEDKESAPMEDPQVEKGTLSVQKALLLVFERIAEGESETNGEDEENNNSSNYVIRLLVLSSQVGCLLGKGGSVIKQMAAESGAQIRILPRDKLPLCALPSDELVQITGELDACKQALQSISQQLLENPPREFDTASANTTASSSHLFGSPLPRSEAQPPLNYSFPTQGAPFASGARDMADYHSNTPSLHKFHESSMPGRMKPQDGLTFRLLCHDERVGGIIGKGGIIIKNIQNETGCEIIVLEGVPDSEDRIIFISGPVHPEDRIFPAQDAVLRVQNRIVRAAPDSKEKTVMARLLVSSSQIGCLLGKGGAIIAEMRKLSGAHIRIVGKDQIPKCVAENEEVVQINGEYEAVQEALLQITTRLRNHHFRDAFLSANNPAFTDQGPPFPPYLARREFSPPGLYSNLGPSFHKFDAVGVLPPPGGFHPHDDRGPFMHSMHRMGIAPHIPERKPSSAPWGPQGLIESGAPMGLADFGPQRRRPGFGGGSQQAIITNTTVKVVVPRSLVPSIYGEDGGCLKQILQISDANITITEPKPGAKETEIIISGTPEQTHAAQSLIQAFVLSEAQSP